MNGVKLYRKRLIPEECILLKDDHLFYQSPDILMTAWSALKPKPDLDHGISCYYLKEGFKISKFYDHQNRFMYWYCDIISHQYDKEENRYIFTDLLADVILYPDNRLRVIDLDELSLALSGGLLQKEDVCDARRNTGKNSVEEENTPAAVPVKDCGGGEVVFKQT